MVIDDANQLLMELVGCLAHDRIGQVISQLCQNKKPSLKGFKDENKAAMLEFALTLTRLKQLL